ncbi:MULTISPECIES: PaaI family thioesterase [Mycobacterium]|uniref:Thioesterase n=17 Tax=Mycobacterium tuberculosis TaxID=1773 RepID=A0A5R1ZC30_MYCTX|nr:MULTISPECIES: PaaI family thioesterase [Mycobacterium tuberculosis complex]AGJ67907.1 hypothetical protein J112_09850 [Mycobacterium tuberculosis str. Beijing/NITR203]KAK26929.1 esterase [Mycobacterium tuberculosis CWCFVRF MDRTB 670]AEJ46894.1 hypothetical protein CCDC5079_1704 [Mycobacterium tuberculosis CCDC5079]AEJ50519.1 hypothetical protein CCDC5180_1682 [Mycobacterium tuberculosis CCDC5180]AGM00372.1 hypothetical protein CFBS_1939 [Mycobacterium tuberculosis CCDC5079]
MQPSPDSPAPLNVTVPFDSELGLQFTELGPDGARAQLDVRPKLLQLTGVVHGGVYCAMIESIASMAAFAWLNSHGEGGSVVGVNNNTDFVRSISSGMVYGTAEPLHRGRRQQLWLVTITDDTDRVVARGQVWLQNLEARP